MEKYFEIKNSNTTEDLAWEKEANIQANLYLMYDDNASHMDNSFYNNHHDTKTSAELHSENIDFAKFFLGMGYDAETDSNIDAEIKAYFAEAKKQLEPNFNGKYAEC